MKLILTLSFLITLTWTHLESKKEFKDGDTIEYSLDGIREVSLYNHYGDVKVIGTNRKNAKLTYVRRLKSASSAKLEDAKEEVKLQSMNEGDELIIFFEAPDMKFTIDPDGRGYYHSRNWNDWKDRYQVSFEFDMTLEIPSDMNLNVSNHHDGLSVENISGDVYAHNHHKDLELRNIGSQIKASTHHGNVIVSHIDNPDADSYYKTHHGDIKVQFEDGLSADVSLKSHHGSFFSDFDWKTGPIKTSVDSDHKGTKYKIGKDTRVIIGSGGPSLDFRTHHGDIYLLSKS